MEVEKGWILSNIALYSFEIYEMTQRFLYLKVKAIIMDSICSNSRSAPNVDIGNCLFCIFHMNQADAATVTRRKVHQGSNGILFTVRRHVDTTAW
jgi:hypothetical protein